MLPKLRSFRACLQLLSGIVALSTASALRAGVTRQAGVFATEGDGTETSLLSDWTSTDGRHASASLFGRTSTLDLSPFTGPGAFSSETTLPNITETRAYGPQGLLGAERRDGQGALLDASTVARAVDGLSVDVSSTADGNLHADFDLAGRLLGVDGDEGGIDIQYLPGTDLPVSIIGNGEYQTVSYHANGLPRTIAASRQPPCELEWDSQARLSTLTTHRGDQATVTTWVRHPQTGRLLRKEVNGQTVESYAWRANGQLESVAKPGGATVLCAYGSDGDLAGTVESAPGLASETVTNAYNRLGALASRAVAGGVAESFDRDLDGTALATAVQGHGVVPDHALTYTRAPADGAVLGVTLMQSGAARTVATLRDAAGRVTTLTDGAVSAAYAWNAYRNRSVPLAVNGTAALVLSNGWNQALGVRTNLTWTLPSFILHPSSFSLLRSPGTNRVTALVREDGSRAEIGYDTDGRLTSWARRRADGTLDATRDYAYAYDDAGNVVRAGRADGAGQGRAAFEADGFNFHAVRRWNAIDLVGVAREDAQILVNQQPVLRDGRRFVFALPLREGSSAHVTNLTVLARISEEDEEWVAQQSVTLRVPACPEEIGRTLAGTTVSDSLTEYLFDARNRLRRVTDKIGEPRLQAVYDYYADDRRARKVVSIWTNDAWQASSTNQFIYNEWNLVCEVVTDDDGTTTRDYIWGLDFDGLQSGAWGQEAGGIAGLLAITEVTGSSTNILLPVCDHVGTIHALVAAMTNSLALPEPIIVETRTYSPYGELIEVDAPLLTTHHSPLTSPCPFGFQTKYYDRETGFWYYGYRYYDARACKWLTADPLQEAGGLNLTAFCGGDPINQVDPLGLRPKLTTFLRSGGVYWDANDMPGDVQASVYATDYDKEGWFSGRAFTHAMIGVAGLIEGAALAGYDLGEGLSGADAIGEENIWLSLVNKTADEGVGSVAMAMVASPVRALVSGDAEQFGTAAFGLYIAGRQVHAGGKAYAGIRAAGGTRAAGVRAALVSKPEPIRLRHEPMLAPKITSSRIVIGEDMMRVRQAAQKLCAETFEGTGMEANRFWIRSKLGEGYEVYDVGPAFPRRLDRYLIGKRPDSPFYGMERMETHNYQVNKIWERSGKWQGGSFFLGE